MAPYPLLAGATVLALIGPGGSARPVVPTLGLAVLTAAWFGLMRWWPGRGWQPVGYFLGLLVLVTALVVWSPWYAFVSWLIFPVALVLFSSRGAVAGLITATVVVTVAQTRPWPLGWPEPSYPVLLNVVLPLLAAAWLVGSENDERRVLLAERAELQRRLVDQARQAAVAMERARLARELHDTVAQALTATVAQLEAAQQHENDPARWRPHVEHAADLARSGLAETRRSVQALRPSALDGHDLGDALHRLADEMSDAVGVRVEVVGDSRPLSPEVEHALYRVTQEALTNIAKHAQASTVYLTLSWLDDLLLVDVRDDGCGFEPDESPLAGQDLADRGFGLTAMRQRMRRVGGALVVETTPGEGTSQS